MEARSRAGAAVPTARGSVTGAATVSEEEMVVEVEGRLSERGSETERA